MDLKKALGLGATPTDRPDAKLVHYINLKLAALGCPVPRPADGSELDELVASFLLHNRETRRLLANYLCPADWRLQRFIDEFIYEVSPPVKLPSQTFVLDRHGLARALSLPADRDEHVSELVSSYRVKQGVLHNPRSDRRTTQGIFHVAEGGLPIPDDKAAAPRVVFARLLKLALSPPEELLRLPFTASQPEAGHARCFVSLLLRPVVCPEVAGFTPEKSMEIRFFAPGSLVSNLDFVESIFGNAGDPFLPENDAGLDVEHWTGHSGCVILAPHLVRATKQSLGLPHRDAATERQRRDGMCWEREDECYNNGGAFKITARGESGVMVTLIADNYFGYCKKEVKTQISFSANLSGLCEEEHAGGALVFPSYDLGEDFSADLHVRHQGHTFEEVTRLFGEWMDLRPEGHGIDRRFPEILYVPEDVRFDLHTQTVSWTKDGARQSIRLLPDKIYVRPSGYRVHMEKPPGYNRAWRLVGTLAEPVLCHKPCTVSGGGKSEISKPITDAILTGPVFVTDFKKDFDQVAELIRRDYSRRFKDPKKKDTRPVLSPERSVGSVIKLLTPAAREYTAEYNAWLKEIPQHIKELVFVVKRYWKPEWGADWRRHFGVDVINGVPGNELKCDNRKLVTTYLRVGFEPDGAWRVFGMRKDFHPAAKLAVEDDISVSVVVPADRLERLNPEYAQPSVKFVKNCEHRLFQRPDDAIHPGYDKQTEADLAQPGNFLSNFEPLPPAAARALVEDTIGFEQFTPPMQRMIREVAEQGAPAWFVSSAQPRLVDGKPTKNPRYLQTRPDLANPRDAWLAEVGLRFQRLVPPGQPVHTPVNAVLPGRRNNPADPAAGIRSLAAYNPIHYMELPELFMEFICSVTGKSPSTTGAGSEGALTKGPFNALPPIFDLNNALVAFLLTGHDGFVTAAGCVGPHARMDHDISLLVPEVWCRMKVEERTPRHLIENGFLEKCKDFEHEGRKAPASRLGYRITARFVRAYFGRVFNHPHLVFTDKMLRPETQDPASFVEAVDNLVATHQRVAGHYFNDGGIDLACPPLRALLHVMRDGHWQGKGLENPELRRLFTREHLLSSDWYAARLAAQQANDSRLWERHVASLENFLGKETHTEEAARLGIRERLGLARETLAKVRTKAHLESLRGTLGAQPMMTDSSVAKAASAPTECASRERRALAGAGA
jgi:hypothetical protein